MQNKLFNFAMPPFLQSRKFFSKISFGETSLSITRVWFFRNSIIIMWEDKILWRMKHAEKRGRVAGRVTVREWNPDNDLKRTWFEDRAHNGKVLQVRPEKNDGIKIHYRFDDDGNFVDKW